MLGGIWLIVLEGIKGYKTELDFDILLKGISCTVLCHRGSKDTICRAQFQLHWVSRKHWVKEAVLYMPSISITSCPGWHFSFFTLLNLRAECDWLPTVKLAYNQSSQKKRELNQLSIYINPHLCNPHDQGISPKNIWLYTIKSILYTKVTFK